MQHLLAGPALGTNPAAVVGPTCPLSALMTRPAPAVDAATTLADVVALMRAASVSAVLVGPGRAIATERDVARVFAAGAAPEDPVADAATPHPLAVPESMPVVDAAALMLNEEVRHLVVLGAEGAEPGVVSMREILAVLLQAVDPHLWLTSLRMAIDTRSEIWLG